MGWEAWFTLAVIGLVFYGLIRELAPSDVLLMGGAISIIVGMGRSGEQRRKG